MKLPASICLAALLSACSTTPHYDASFGDAVRQSRQRMTLNPDAGQREVQVAGMDGKAAHEAIRLYQDSFKAPPPVVNVIQIGGPSSANK